MGVAALFVGRDFGNGWREYRSRVTGRKYLLNKRPKRGFYFIDVYHEGRRIYGGTSPDRAFRMIELEDCI